MAAKRGKSVLSRQEIANRKRALSDQKLQTDGAGKRALIGLFVLAASVLALLSVATFDAHDRVGPGFRNWIGPVGHALAEAMRGVLGICAFIVPIAGIYAAVALFVGSRSRRRWPQALCFVLLSTAGAVLAQLVLGGEPGWAHAPGGAVGRALSEIFVGLFGVVGTVVLVSAVCAAALIVGTQFAFLKLCAWAWRAGVAFAARARAWTLQFAAAQKEALAARREEAKKAKLEEQKFLEKLEAEQAALEAAEREAEEAEAMAEEAHRLAKAAEEAKLARKNAKKRPAPPELLSAPPVMLPRDTDPRMEVPPGADPAWAASLAPPPPPVVEPAPAPSKRAARKPNIVVPPTPPVEALAESIVEASPLPSGEGQGEGSSLPASEPVKPVETSPEPAPPPPAQAEPPMMNAAAAALARRTPVIVEPKAPPKPTKKNEFEFVGDRKSFNVPPIDVLELDKKERSAIDKDAFFSTAEKLRAKLADFGIVGEVVEIRPGPVVTMYEFLPGPGIKISKIASLADDLAMAMEAMRVRIVAPIPGKGVVGIEVPNKDRETVFLKEIAEQDAFQKSQSRLTMCLGKDIEGMPYVLDLGKAPHLLIAGTTGSGKSVAVNSMIMSILLKSTPEEVRFIMVDPKMLELSVYEGIPHLLLPVVTDPKKAALALRWAVEEMERRYQLLSEAGVRNIAGYNKFVESKASSAVVDGKLVENKPSKDAEPSKVEAAPPPPPNGKKRRMQIIDVAEEDAKPGVAAPIEPPAEIREAVAPDAPPDVKPEVTPEAEVKAKEEIRVDEQVMSVEEKQALEDAAASKPEEPEKKEWKKLPYIVVIIDELADLMMVASREVETYIARLAQMARAAGIHLMVATQRPSTDVVTGVIKANFPTRISFMLRSKPDSMTILGTVGAEALLGMGDMLLMPPTSANLVRVHGAYVSEGEIKKAVDHLKAQGKPVFDESILKAREEDVEGGGEEDELSDELYDQALAVVSEMRTVSISMLQRKMRIGYNRAARMIERMERDGIVGAADGAKPREVLIRPVGEMPAV